MCFNCTCGTGKTGVDYQTCTGAAAQRLPNVPDSVLMNYAASAGATSSNPSMCAVTAFLIARRLIYYKCSPGDCGAPGFALTNTGASITKGIVAGSSAAATVDPEPISKAILTGIADVVGVFGQAHANAVATEQTTICGVSVNYNSAVQGLEQAVEQGVMLPSQAASVLDQITAQLDAVLAGLAKPCNASCIFRIGLRALNQYFDEQVFAALAPSVDIPGITPILAPPPIASAATPGTTGNTGLGVPLPVTTMPLPANVGNYTGASGYIPAPLNANNAGVGATAALSIPGNLPVGAIVLIGGVAYIASQSGAGAGAAVAA
jgi:hypothetical protein